MLFLYDNGREYQYENLLRSINENTIYYPYYKTSDLYSYFVNLIKALIFSQPLVLLDSDINPSEIDGLDESIINVEKKIETSFFSSIEEVIKGVQTSQSEITIFTSGTTGQPKKVVHSISTLTRSC